MEFLDSNFHITSPNTIKYTNKFVRKIPQNKIEQVFWVRSEVQDCKDGSGLHLSFGQDVQKSKAPIMVNF